MPNGPKCSGIWNTSATGTPANSIATPNSACWFRKPTSNIPRTSAINQQAFGHLRRSAESDAKIHNLADLLKRTLYDFVERFAIDILIIENALCIPVHIPLGIALTTFPGRNRLPHHRPPSRFLLGTQPLPGQCRRRLPADGLSPRVAHDPARHDQHVRPTGTGPPQGLSLRADPERAGLRSGIHRPTTMRWTCVARSVWNLTTSWSCSPRESCRAKESNWPSTWCTAERLASETRCDARVRRRRARLSPGA